MVEPAPRACASTSVACWLSGLENGSALNWVRGMFAGGGGWGSEGDPPPPQPIRVLRLSARRIPHTLCSGNRRFNAMFPSTPRTTEPGGDPQHRGGDAEPL